MSGWTVAGGTPEARAFVAAFVADHRDEIVDGVCETLRRSMGVTIDRALPRPRGPHPSYVLLDEIDGYRPYYPAVVSRQLYDRLVAAYPELTIEARMPPLISQPEVQDALAAALPAYFPPSKPLIEEPCL